MNSYERYERSSSATLARRVQESPHDADLRFFLGLKLLDERELHAAAVSLQAALTIQPEFPDAAIYLVRTLFKLGEDAKAEDVLMYAIRWERYLGERFLLLARICQRNNRYREARSYYLQALELDEHLGHLPHRGLTDLLERGEFKNVRDYKLAQIDERIHVQTEFNDVFARLRIFDDQINLDRTVVVLTSEADEAERGCYGLGVTNGAELLIEYVLNNPSYGVDPANSTWVLLHEVGAHGLPPMHLCRVTFDVRERSHTPKGLWQALCAFFCEPAEQTTELCVGDLRFHEITHAELERSISHRFFWG